LAAATESFEPEHRRLLRQSAVDFVARASSLTAVRAALASESGFDRARWRQIAELGWTGLAIPEALDGLGLGAGEIAALHEVLGRGLLPEPLAAVALLAGGILARSDNAPMRSEILTSLLSGERIVTLAWQGARGGLGVEAVGPSASPDGQRWKLSGTAAFVPLATAADSFVVAAKAPAGIAFFLAGKSNGMEIKRQATAEHSNWGEIDFDLALPESALLMPPIRGGAVLEEVLDVARVALSAELLGLMEQAFALTLDYLRQRRQFGKPIGSFQALQHRAVDLYVQIELARSALARAVEVLESANVAEARASAVSAAKARCSDAALLVTRQAIQLHGAIGYTEEYDLSLFVRRALVLSAWLGNAAAHRRRYARLTLAKAPLS
jgi:alkylation response protein AidB-like acyl-CoA dehydrogenase